MNNTTIFPLPEFPKDKRGESFAQIKQTHQHLDGYTFIINTITVRPCDSNGNVITNKRKAWRTTDDSFYLQHPEYHRIFPRSYSILTIQQNNKFINTIILKGFYKFTGLSEVDDDDGVVCNGLQPKNLDDEYSKVLVTQKANGKNIVITSFHLGNCYYLFGGSKNVHRVAKMDNRYALILNTNLTETPLLDNIFSSFWKQIINLTNKERLNLFSLLTKQKKCLCGEYLDGKHMVSETTPHIVWFGLTDVSEN